MSKHIFSYSIKDNNSIIDTITNNSQNCNNKNSINLNSCIKHHPNSISSSRNTYTNKCCQNYYNCQNRWWNLFSNSSKRKNHINHHSNYTKSKCLTSSFLHIISYTWTNNCLIYNFFHRINIVWFLQKERNKLRNLIYLLIIIKSLIKFYRNLSIWFFKSDFHFWETFIYQIITQILLKFSIIRYLTFKSNTYSSCKFFWKLSIDQKQNPRNNHTSSSKNKPQICFFYNTKWFLHLDKKKK